MSIEAVVITPYFELKETFAQRQAIETKLNQRGKEANEYIQKLISNRNIKSRAISNQFNIPDLPSEVQKMLGDPKDRYALEFTVDRRVKNTFVLKILNLCERDRGLKVEFYTQADVAPYGFQFLTVEEGKNPEIVEDFKKMYDFRYNKNLMTILAAMLLGKASEYLL